MMRISLYVKFIFGYILYGIAVFITIVTLSSKLTYDYLLSSGASTLYDEASLIASTYSTVYSGGNMELAQAYPQLKAVSTFLQAQIWVVDRQGQIIVESGGVKDGQVIDDFDPTATGNKSYMTGNYFGSFSYEVLSVSAPIIGHYTTHGYVVIHLPVQKVIERREEILGIVYLTSSIVFLLSFFIMILFQISVYSPLRKITAATKEYAAGNLRYRIELDSQDEMGYLARTLNYMSDELYKGEDYQKNFITNISHDFRSPLTSIKGYLEAMLDGTIEEPMREKYLHRVLGETDRLTKLTEGILTLHALDKKGYLKRSSFDIKKAIKDTAASFEVQCKQKSIGFQLIFSRENHLVYGDKGQIQQVLYNLIDNAIKFSPPESEIRIEVEEKGEKVFVSVKDRGIGIPKKDIKKVFDRFYKSDTSRGRDKKGIGLGLAIVRDILQSHGEMIDVVSTEGVGTEFIFSLPQASEREKREGGPF